MDFKLGDYVEVIDEEIEGYIIKMSLNKAWINVDGFEYEYPLKSIIAKELFNVSVEVDAPKEIDLKKTLKNKKSTEHIDTIEIDLHFESLSLKFNKVSNFEILMHQLQTARKKLLMAFEKKIPRVVFIHGVGQGVLKKELDSMLREFSNIEWYAADFRKYGEGATEVRIYTSRVQ